MTDPYSVLGITPSADDETIKKAYRKKCKEYHPDLHPDDPSAEEHFKEVQAAYSEIMRIKQGGGASYSAGGQRYGSSQSGCAIAAPEVNAHRAATASSIRTRSAGPGLALDRSGLGITAQAARPGGRATVALPVTQSCVPRQTTSAAASMRRP